MTQPSWRHAAFVLVMVFIPVGGACSSGLDCEDADPPDHPLTWDAPLIGAEEHSTVSQARDVLNIDPIVPVGLGPTAKIQARKDAIAFIYRHPELGRFYVIESRAQTDQAGLEAQITQCDESPECEGSLRMREIAPGVRALQIEGCFATGLLWLRAELLLNVVGPAGTLSPDESVSIAERFLEGDR